MTTNLTLSALIAGCSNGRPDSCRGAIGEVCLRGGSGKGAGDFLESNPQFFGVCGRGTSGKVANPAGIAQKQFP
jgi:hypothetical protein